MVRRMRVLIACEFSGIVREAFRKLGHDAFSCDLLPAEDFSPFHIQKDLTKFDPSWFEQWDLIIAHPPCTHLASSGARWFVDKQAEQTEAVQFVLWLSGLPARRIAIENPI